MLGERYLWVEALCIVEDNNDLTAKIPLMGQIYGGALLIIASIRSLLNLLKYYLRVQYNLC